MDTTNEDLEDLDLDILFGEESTPPVTPPITPKKPKRKATSKGQADTKSPKIPKLMNIVIPKNQFPSHKKKTTLSQPSHRGETSNYTQRSSNKRTPSSTTKDKSTIIEIINHVTVKEIEVIRFKL